MQFEVSLFPDFRTLEKSSLSHKHSKASRTSMNTRSARPKRPVDRFIPSEDPPAKKATQKRKNAHAGENIQRLSSILFPNCFKLVFSLQWILHPYHPVMVFSRSAECLGHPEQGLLMTDAPGPYPVNPGQWQGHPVAALRIWIMGRRRIRGPRQKILRRVDPASL